MTEHRSPLDAALDLVVYVPVGLALTISEELPKLAAKGRSTVTGRVTTARMVGQFAVTQGRQQIERRLHTAPPPPSRPASGMPAGAATNGAAGTGTLHTVPPTTPTSPPPQATPPASPSPSPAGRRPAPAATPTRSPAASSDGGPSAPAPAPAGPAAESLAIPGYDSLSASQVVQRLAGLSAPELDAVKAYEAANRGRRTILARISQLQA